MIPGPIGRVQDECGCYPECKIDCPDREKCLDDMPEYQTKLDKAKRYAAAVVAGKSERPSLD